MAVALRSVGVSPGASSTTCVIVKPVGLASGDLMVAHIGSQDNAETPISPPAGWTEVVQQPFTGKGIAGLFRKIADASDAAASDFTFTTGDESNLGAIMAITGFDSGTPVSAYSSNPNSGNPCDTTTITPTVANSMIVIFAMALGQRTCSDYQIATANPASWTEAYDIATSAGGDSSVAAGYALRPETSATGTGQSTHSSNADNVAMMIAISPASGGIDYPISASAGLTMATSASRVMSVNRDAVTNLSLTAIASRVVATIRSATSNLSLTAVATKIRNRIISAIANLNAAAFATRKVALSRSALVNLSLTASAAKVWNRTISAVANLSLTASASRFIASTRSSTANLSLTASAVISTVTNYIISAVANLNVNAIASRVFSINRSATANLSLTAMASRFMAIGRSAVANLRLTSLAEISELIRAIALTLATRATSFTLKSRSTSLTLTERTMNFTLPERTTNFTLPDRTTDFTLPER